MSGTSLDGVDAVLADFRARPWRLVASFHLPYPENLRERLLALHEPRKNELHWAALIGVELSRIYAEAADGVLAAAGIPPGEVAAIGCHGQTVRHQPRWGYSIQLGNPAWLAELTGITVVADFRSRDLAAGGEGAPLVPAFHRALFQDPARHRVVVNIGGIANLTDLPPKGKARGFDCGPGNLLLDAWARLHRGTPFDRNGAWGKTGKALPGLLSALLEDEFFHRPPPKSTGRDHFNLAWLTDFLSGAESPEDVQATLLALTAEAIARAVAEYCPGTEQVFLCGGGARNQALEEELSRRLAAPVEVETTDALGVPAEGVEAFAFAWLARQTLLGRPGNLPAVTGARGERILGAIYKA